MSDALAWLIERGGLCLGFCEHKFAWVTFTNEGALRFSRSRDAYSFMETVKWTPFNLKLEGAIITEHLWDAAGQAAPTTHAHLDRDAVSIARIIRELEDGRDLPVNILAERILARVENQSAAPPDHLKHIQRWLTEMYQTMVDPVEEFDGKIEQLCALLLERAREDRQALESQAASAAELSADRIAAIFDEHTTSYTSRIDAGWDWSCSCGEKGYAADHEFCQRLTRGHWANVIGDALLRGQGKAGSDVCKQS